MRDILSNTVPPASLQSVENSVCILRNLSYRLEMEVDRERYEDAPLPSQAPEKEPAQPGCVMGCGSAARRKVTRSRPSNDSLDRKEPVQGVELLWHPEIIRPYLSILAEASNPETLEGAAGAIHNLTACRWRVSSLRRSEKLGQSRIRSVDPRRINSGELGSTRIV